MNNRIKEIAIQAGGIWQAGYVEQPDGSWEYKDEKWINACEIDVEQLAELFVRECAKICKESGDVPAALVAEDILLHFGFEK